MASAIRASRLAGMGARMLGAGPWGMIGRGAGDAAPIGGGDWRWMGSRAEEAEEMPDAHKTQKGWGQTKIRELLAWKRDQGKSLFCCNDDTVFAAVKKMADGNVGSLVVVDPKRVKLEDKGPLTSAPEEAVVGIITERDYLRKMVVEGRSSKETLVSEIMTPESKLMTCSLDSSVVEAMQIMADKNVRHLPVVDKNTMMGMVSIRDTVKVMVMEHRQEIDQIHKYIQGSY
eukprot:evm.model.scf_1933.1 EVM.evm.TU.scf_1933.1   scf_1933:657-2128(+)